jgi:hypothetical protein
LKTLVTVVQPVEANIRVEAGRDDRMLYSLGAVAGLAILFGVVAVVSVAGGGEGGARRRGRSGEELEEDFAEAGPLAIEEIGTRAGDRKAQGVAG